ncbi:SH2 domain-containing protein 6 [Dromiciops gliroides]|uniref:SH2 domain-containing protein 6 n=1 Tax=Dromiciops gliroides TaxID=33562 RepID=UPI001CC78810|nr:SH2 domain-containing protein 6 [Dromiciops gliroides]
MDKIGGNKPQSLCPLPPPRSLVPPSWREDTLGPSSPSSPGLLRQWDAEEEEDGEGEYELPPCESLSLKMAPTGPLPLEKDKLYLNRCITPGPPKPAPRPTMLLAALSLQEAVGGGDHFGRKDVAASGSTDLAREDESEEAIYLEPSLASPLTQALGPQAPPPRTVIPRPTMAPRSASKPTSVSQEAWSGMADVTYNAGRSALTGSPPADEDASMLGQPWYSAHCDRHTVENALLYFHKDGTYTVRPSSDPQGSKPFTLAVFFHGYVYNIPIRWLDAQRQYALGREGKSYEKLFPTVAAMVQHFSQNPLPLVNRHTGKRQHTRLLFPTKP